MKTNIEQTVPLRLQIENVHAVKKADIIIDGLTVLCGENGAGKSTIARLLEDAIEADLYFDDAYRAVLLTSFYHEVISKLRIFAQVVLRDSGQDIRWHEFKVMSGLMSHSAACEQLDKFDRVLDELRSRLATVSRRGDERRNRDISEVIKIVSSEIKVKSRTIESLMTAFRRRADMLRQKITDIKTANLTYENFNAAELYSPVLWDGNVILSEMGRRVLAYSGNSTSVAERFISVKDVVYIESPLISTLRWNEDGNVLTVSGNFAPLHSSGRYLNNVDEDFLMKSFSRIMHGTIEYKKTPQQDRRWMYMRDDGEEFLLANSATGIKSFALLTMLHSYGCLNKNTVLIVDEPEAHLHPRWVVEYARMIINLIMDSGVRVLMASHSPDMINALQSFAQAKSLDERTRFYQAVPIGKSHPYDFKYINRGMDVGKIFDAFNKVYPDIEEFTTDMKIGEQR